VHLALSGVTCEDCHTTAGDGSALPTSNHLDDNIDVSNGYPMPNTIADSTYSTCTNFNCHGTTTSPDTWGADLSARDNCTICHGFKTDGADGTIISTINNSIVAPGEDKNNDFGVDTAGHSADTDPQVGAHFAHLTAASGISNTNGIGCNECHTVPTAPMDAGHIDSGSPAEVPVDGELAETGSGTAGYVYGTRTCTNVYCHNEAYFSTSKHTDGGTGTAPVWTDASYIVPPTDDAECGKCHYYEGAANCSGCHDHVDEGDISFSGIANRAKHINGSVDAAGNCDSCHGYPPRSDDGHGAINGTGGKGAHWSVAINGAHIDNSALDAATDTYDTGLTQCVACHPMLDAGHPEDDNAADIGFGVANRFDSGPVIWGGVSGENPSSTPKTCSNVNCHFGAPTPRWSCPGDE
jgi:predicted CxxxxCH...CXXCH cytochrome family protein